MLRMVCCVCVVLCAVQIRGPPRNDYSQLGSKLTLPLHVACNQGGLGVPLCDIEMVRVHAAYGVLCMCCVVCCVDKGSATQRLQSAGQQSEATAARGVQPGRSGSAAVRY